jgi:hypothetical protein
MLQGLDMRFLGEKRQKKNKGNCNGNRMSCLAVLDTAIAKVVVGTLSVLASFADYPAQIQKGIQLKLKKPVARDNLFWSILIL